MNYLLELCFEWSGEETLSLFLSGGDGIGEDDEDEIEDEFDEEEDIEEAHDKNSVRRSTVISWNILSEFYVNRDFASRLLTKRGN